MIKHRFWGAIGFLVLLDQGIKLLINANFRNQVYNIIGEYVRFEPHLNVDFSWVNSMLDLGISKVSHIALVSVVLLFSGVVFSYIGAKNKRDKLVDSVFIFLFSGALCSLLDKVFWGGSLDYIALKGFFIFDLKDVYVTVVEILVIGMVLINYKGLLSANEKKIFFDFVGYVQSEITRVFSRN